MTVKSHKPKISFNTSPGPRVEVAPEPRHVDAALQVQSENAQAQYDDTTPLMQGNVVNDFYEGGSPEVFEPAPAPRPDVKAMDDLEFDRAEWEKQLTAPTPAAAVTPAPIPMPKPKSQNARLAALGQMAPPKRDFMSRNDGMLGVAAIVGVTFFLGLGAAISFFGDDQGEVSERATFSDPMTVPVFSSSDVTEPATETATRALTADMTDVSTLTPAMVTNSTSSLTATVLAGLQPELSGPEQVEPGNTRLSRDALDILIRNNIRMLREGVLADVYEIETYEQSGVERVRLRALNAPLINEQTSEVLLKAVEIGQLELSESLITPEGTVDVETMMFNLVQTSLNNDHNPAAVDAALVLSRKIFAASAARTQNVNGDRVYRVQAGDSLAYIALQFYGSPTAYKRILEANRSKLQSPEQIQLGQRLIIPS